MSTEKKLRSPRVGDEFVLRGGGCCTVTRVVRDMGEVFFRDWHGELRSFQIGSLQHQLAVWSPRPKKSRKAKK